MCKGSREFVDHLLLHISFMGELSSVVFVAFQWVMPKKVIDVHFNWQGLLNKNNKSFLWKGASLCLMWTIWRVRNSCSFEDVGNQFLNLDFLSCVLCVNVCHHRRGFCFLLF